jgi:hypothetical protein
MSELTRKDLANLKKLVKNIELLIKLNIDFKNRLERNSRRDLNITEELLKRNKQRNKLRRRTVKKSKRKRRV